MSLPTSHLLVISEAGVAGDREVLQQVNAVVFIISTDSSFQQSLPVIVVPATQKETVESNQHKLTEATRLAQTTHLCVM